MLSFAELQRVAALLDAELVGARIERIVQPAADSLCAQLYLPPSDDGDREPGSRKLCLHWVCRPDFARLSELPRLPRAPDAPPAFCSYLRKHLAGARVRGASVRGHDRQLGLQLETRDGRFVLLFSILGRRTNLYLLDAEEKLLRALRPLDATRPELALGDVWKDPGSPLQTEGEDRFTEVADAELLAAIERELGDQEGGHGEAELRRRIEVSLRKELKLCRRRLEKLEGELAEADQATELQRRGELLKGALSRVEPGATQVSATDYSSGEEVEIPLDPKLSPKQNLDATFKRYQKLIRRLTKAGAQVDMVSGRCDELAALQARLSEIEDGEALATLAADPDVAKLLARHAPAEKRRSSASAREPAPRGPFKDIPRRLHPRRYRSSDGLEIWVGRSDAANDLLTTRLARGNDLFFHVDGAAGTHVILRTEGRADPPSDSLIEASELAVHFSKAKRATRADVHVVPIKNVRKPKGAKPGLVVVTGGKSLHLRREEARLRRVLDSRIDE